MNYLQFNDRGKFEPEEQALANYFGEGNYTGFYKKHFLRDKFQLTKDDFIAGDIDVMFHAMKRLDIEYSYNDYPECLKPYLHRKIWEDTLGNVRREIFEEGYLKNPIFIKPKDKLKRFTGFVLETVDDLSKCKGAGNQTKIWCSEPVKFISEYRYYIRWKMPSDSMFCDDAHPGYEIVGMGSFNKNVNWDEECKVHRQIYRMASEAFDKSTFMHQNRVGPIAFAMDVGVLSTGEIALVEINDAFSLGLYNEKVGKEYAECLIARWNELKGLK